LEVPVKAVPLVAVLALVLSSATHSQVAVSPRDVGRPAQTGTARLRGRVVSQTGLPVRRAQISLLAQGGGDRRQTTTDIDGRYEFVELAAGRYAVSASKAGFVGLSYGQRRPNQAGTPVVVQYQGADLDEHPGQSERRGGRLSAHLLRSGSARTPGR
jgi:hypothetical protein